MFELFWGSIYINLYQSISSIYGQKQSCLCSEGKLQSYGFIIVLRRFLNNFIVWDIYVQGSWTSVLDWEGIAKKLSIQKDDSIRKCVYYIMEMATKHVSYRACRRPYQSSLSGLVSRGFYIHRSRNLLLPSYALGCYPIHWSLLGMLMKPSQYTLVKRTWLADAIPHVV